MSWRLIWGERLDQFYFRAQALQFIAVDFMFSQSSEHDSTQSCFFFALPTLIDKRARVTRITRVLYISQLLSTPVSTEFVHIGKFSEEFGSTFVFVC